MKSIALILLTTLFAGLLPAAASTSTVTEILSKYSHNSWGWSALNYAIERKDYEAATVLLNHVRDFNKIDGGFNPLSRILLALSRGSLDDKALALVDLLLEKGINVTFPVDDIQHILMYALHIRNIDLVVKLLEAGANPNENRGKTFISAVQNEDMQIIELFIRKGARTSYEPLDCAIRSQRYDIINLLVKHGADISSDFPLQTAIFSYQTVEFLLNLGVKIKGETRAIRAAVENSNYDTVKLLLEHGASITSDNQRIPSLLQIAVTKNDVMIVQLLLEAGANPNTPLIFHANDNSGRIHNYDNNGSTTLLELSLKKPLSEAREKIIDLLLEYGAKLP